MRFGLPKESASGERRVALVPTARPGWSNSGMRY